MPKTDLFQEVAEHNKHAEYIINKRPTVDWSIVDKPKSTNEHHTQQDRILKLLKANANEWVSLKRILSLGIAQYNTRIHELKARGYKIVNMTNTIQGQRLSWFKLMK